MRFLLLMLLSFPALAGEVVLENDYVRVTRDAAPCALSHVPECGDRVIVALGEIELASDGARRTMARGDIAVFGSGESYEPPSGGPFLEVSIKADHPPVQSPGERIPPEKNAMRYDGEEFFIFEEKLAPGDTRARHSHSQRVVIQLNRARLRQWSDGEPSKFVETVPERPAFSPPVIHTVENVGDTPLRGIVIEFKPKGSS
jgi:quercetin dioxygenase-like cupin family protein